MWKSIAVNIIKGLLWILDKDHRSREEIAMDDTKKFTHIVDTKFQSDFGTSSKIFRTVPYEAWELKTETKRLIAADKHRVIRADHSAAWIEDLLPGDLIKTDVGIEKVVSARSLGVRTHMYCMEVSTEDPSDPHNHLFYSDGILSHNTTCSAAFLLWKAMFSEDTTVLIVGNTYNAALEIMHRVTFMYENCPDHIKAGVKALNKGSIEFDNGSRLVSRATTPSAGRGLSITLLYCDEFAFLAPNLSRDFFAAIQPTLSTGGSCIISSTPKSDTDQFSDIWRGAIDTTDEYGNPNPTGVGKNGFFAIEVPWWEHPDRDEEWAKPFRQSLGEARFRQEFENAFITDDETLINSVLLAKMKAGEPDFYTGTVRWFKEPEPNKGYLVGLDPSLGTGRDYAAIQIFELPGMAQVGEWQHNQTTTRGQVRVLLQVLNFIDQTLRSTPEQKGDPEIFWTVENNSIGEAVLQVIEDTGEEKFPGIFMSEKKRKGQTRRFRKGFNTDNRKKLSACARMKSLVESNRMKINSTQLIRQLKNFVAREASFAGKPGEHDDLVMASLLVVRMLDQAINWSYNGEDLREAIHDDESYDEPMPVEF